MKKFKMFVFWALTPIWVSIFLLYIGGHIVADWLCQDEPTGPTGERNRQLFQ